MLVPDALHHNSNDRRNKVANQQVQTNGGNASLQRFAGKVVVVTGGGSGIGEAAARRIAAEGGKVVVTGRRPEPIERVASDIGGLAVTGDTTSAEHCEAVMAAAVERFGGVNVLVANAGATEFGSVESLDLDGWRANFDVNLNGAMLMARHAIPRLRQRGGGAVVLVASMAALSGAPSGAPYLASKAAMLGLNRSIAVDYGPEGIRCNVICPGWAPTDMTKETLATLAEMRGKTAEAFFDQITRPIPLRRMADPAEMASVIAFLASSDASFMTGATLVVDGGASLIDGSTAALFPE